MKTTRPGTGDSRTPADVIRVLVVEDSPTVRMLLMEMLQSDPAIQVAGVAADGVDAVRQAVRLAPDLITMDVNMPGQDGLTATREIMSEAPTPIIIVSATANQRAVELSFAATQAGALLVLPKPYGPLDPSYAEQTTQLVAMVKAMAQVKVVRRWHSRRSRPSDGMGRKSVTRTEQERVRAIAIGCSTGGPAALHRILTGLSPAFPVPIVVVQHMARGFVSGLASWLNSATQLRVKVASAGELLQPGHVYLAPDQHHLGVATRGVGGPESRLVARLHGSPPISGFRPSATCLFADAARTLGAGCVGVVLTGMGDDGVAGLRELHDAGGFVIAQDEASSVVFGMAREAIHGGVVDEVLPVDTIATRLTELVR